MQELFQTNKYQLRDYQQQAADIAVDFFNEKKAKYNAIEVLPTGCHAKGYQIMMYNSLLKNVEDIQVGDEVMGNDGMPRKVLRLHRGIDDMYMITPIKGLPFVVNGGHILSLYKSNEGGTEPCKQSRYDEISVRDYLTTSKTYKHTHKLYKPNELDFVPQEKKLPIEPYFLGLMLGDGTCHDTISVTTMRTEVRDYLYEYVEKHGYFIRETKNKKESKATSYNIAQYKDKVGGRTKRELRVKLEELGLWGARAENKFIPCWYKTASREERLELLAGLLDTDAYYYKGTYEYCSKSLSLITDLQFLCRSLGFYCSVNDKYVNGVRYYRSFISGNLSDIPTKVGIRKGGQRQQKKSVYVTGFTVEYVGRGEFYGFELDGNHLYLDWQMFVHHNSGKSLIIADIASRIDGNLLVFCPSKEILEQNYEKMRSYGIQCSVWSASLNSKVRSRITLATIGSVRNCHEVFEEYKYVMIDECHLVNSISGQYKDFIEAADRKVLGLTATPYRLTSVMGEAVLKFLTRTRPRIFSKVIYVMQPMDLINRGYLSLLRYFDMQILDTSHIYLNSTGRDYDETSLRNAYAAQDISKKTFEIVERLLHPKNGVPRKGILVFTRFVDDSLFICAMLNAKYGDIAAVVSADTPKKERESIIKDYKEGKIKVCLNANCLSTGFDYPELDTVVLARPTMSLALYSQMAGRAIRPSANKEGWIVDLCGNYKKFGRTDQIEVVFNKDKGGWIVRGVVDGMYKQLSGITFGGFQRDLRLPL